MSINAGVALKLTPVPGRANLMPVTLNGALMAFKERRHRRLVPVWRRGAEMTFEIVGTLNTISNCVTIIMREHTVTVVPGGTRHYLRVLRREGETDDRLSLYAADDCGYNVELYSIFAAMILADDGR